MVLLFAIQTHNRRFRRKDEGFAVREGKRYNVLCSVALLFVFFFVKWYLNFETKKFNII